MSTLADELLQDFEDSGSEGEEQQQNEGLFPDDDSATANGHKAAIASANDGRMELDGDEEEVVEDEEMTGVNDSGIDVEDEEETKARVEKMELGGVDDVRSVAKLMKTLEPVLEVSAALYSPSYTLKRSWFTLPFRVLALTSSALQKIAHYQSLAPSNQTTFVGSIEDNPEYKLLTESNTLSTNIDTEIMIVHKFIRDHYSIRFPELETLVTNPLDYAKVVTIIGNGPMDQESIKVLQTSKDNRLGATLRSVLDGPSVMIVTVEATTTKGREMSPAELERVMRACDMTLALDKAKKTLTDYVQSRMNLFAPNLTALIGSLTAAQLLNFAGGLTGLAKTPACNLPL
jgi:U4/U6 small nuclear ribonucleoprotein PRP31